MALFNLHYDTKETVWYRQNYNVEADTPQQAAERLLAHLETGEFDTEHVTQCDGDYLIETKTLLTPEENDGEATEIIYLAGENYDKPSELHSNDDPLKLLNRHGKKLLSTLNQYFAEVVASANYPYYPNAIDQLTTRTRVNLIFMHPKKLNEFYEVTGVPQDFPTELANGIMHVIQTGKMP